METSLIFLGIYATFGLDLTAASNTPSEKFTHSLYLGASDDYQTFWKYDNENITFEVHVRTTGYVGFGISPTGGMEYSDVVIGWVDSEGKAYFHDRHGIGDSEPRIDSEQDWELLAANQTNYHTILKFRRPLVGCLPEDQPIKDGTMRIIWSYSTGDPNWSGNMPKAGSILGLSYHGASQRGVRSVQLLGVQIAKGPFPKDAWHFDILNKNVTIPNDTDTTYWCQGAVFPNMNHTNHIFQIEPVIEVGNENFVHHITLVYCVGEVDDDFLDTGGNCLLMPERTKCSSLFFGWAIGGEKYYFPKHVGFPVKGPMYVLMETHYNNHFLLAGRVDSSGLRFWMTADLRKHDAWYLQTGVQVSHLQMIPPNTPSFVSQGHCTKECLSEVFSRANISEVHVFAFFLHTHLLGKALRVRHFREGEGELPPIAVDNTYDFNFQEMRMLSKEVTIKNGDYIVVECDYDSTHKDTVTKGGIRTTDEMCLAYLLYYPKLPISACISRPTLKDFYPFIKRNPLWPITFARNMSDVNVQKEFQDNMNKAKILQYCDNGWTQPYSVNYEIKKPKTHYKPLTVPGGTFPECTRSLATFKPTEPSIPSETGASDNSDLASVIEQTDTQPAISSLSTTIIHPLTINIFLTVILLILYIDIV